MKSRILTVTLLFLLVLGAAGMAFAAVTDLDGHWAQEPVERWISQGLAGGYPDGTFKPNRQISRAEFVALANRAFKFEASAETTFTDVAATDWYADEIKKASAASYVSGYEDGTFRPGNNISRQEAAAMLVRILGIDTPAGTEAIDKFADAAAIPAWSKGAINSAVTAGLMSGYPDQTFKPARAITRAEAVATLDRALAEVAKPTTFDQAGTYGPATGTETISGNVVISAAGVTLQNTVITGDLLLAENIGDGDVHLKNVTVKEILSLKVAALTA